MSAGERAAAGRAGPFDVVDWPERIKARVIEPGDDPGLHGYSVQSDLSVHYGFTATLYLSLLGELPERDVLRAFDVALTFLAPVPISEAPTHAAALTRLLDGPVRSVLSVAALGLAERAHFIVERNEALLQFLRAGSGNVPSSALSELPSDVLQRERLRSALPPALVPSLLDLPLSGEASLVAVLFRCGFDTADRLEAVWMLAGLAASFAEAMATPPKAFREYPMNMPAFRYQEER